MSIRGHTQYKSSGTCHPPGFLLVTTLVDAQLFPSSPHSFLLQHVILGRKKKKKKSQLFSGAIQLNPKIQKYKFGKLS